VTKVTLEDIGALIELFDKSNWNELYVSAADTDLFLSKDPQARRDDKALLRPLAITAHASSSVSEARRPPSESTAAEVGSQGAGKLGAGGAAQQSHSRGVIIEAPVMGAFYSSPRPGAPPFVSVGQHVSADSELCLIEVMKLFTTVRAGMEGIVCEILVRDSEFVELRQPLFRILPRA
jgi:acetyl-CoA carboxylase biotin carboxyl carrier protein